MTINSMEDHGHHSEVRPKVEKFMRLWCCSAIALLAHSVFLLPPAPSPGGKGNVFPLPGSGVRGTHHGRGFRDAGFRGRSCGGE
jgi:hypothetical protein